MRWIQRFVQHHSSRRLAALLVVLASVATLGCNVPSALGPTATPADAAQRANATATALSKSRLSPLRVAGNRIVNSAGQTVTLVGANQGHSINNCDLLPSDAPTAVADFVAMRAWHINAVEIQLSAPFWMGTAPQNAHCSRSLYRDAVFNEIQHAEEVGLYIVICLSTVEPFPKTASAQELAQGGAQYPLPDRADSVRFWMSIAQRFAGDPNVIFSPFSEPWPTLTNDDSGDNWSLWRRGGSVTVSSAMAAQLAMTAGTYAGLGMADAVSLIRKYAPENLVLVNGVAKGGNLSQVSSYRPDVYRDGATGATKVWKNVAYGVHVYCDPPIPANCWSSTWDQKFGRVSARIPVVALEFGEMGGGTGDLSVSMLPYFNRHKIGLFAYAWCICINRGRFNWGMLASFDGTPSDYGSPIRDFYVAHY